VCGNRAIRGESDWGNFPKSELLKMTPAQLARRVAALHAEAAELDKEGDAKMAAAYRDAARNGESMLEVIARPSLRNVWAGPSVTIKRGEEP
jgi:hypothetical protein